MRKNHPHIAHSTTNVVKITLQANFTHNVGTTPFISSQLTMAVSVDIVGTEEGNRRRSCHIHSYCGQVLDVGSVVCVKLERNFFKGSAKPTLACYLVHDGFDQCKVGFLPHHLVAHATNYANILLQITEVLSEDDSDVWKAEKAKKSRILLQRSSASICSSCNDFPG